MTLVVLSSAIVFLLWVKLNLVVFVMSCGRWRLVTFPKIDVGQST